MFSVFKELLYLVATFLLLFGLKSLALPKTTIKGSVIIAFGIVIAVATVLFSCSFNNLIWIVSAIVIGVAIGLLTKKDKVSKVPEKIAIYNGMGGGAAGLVILVEYLRFLSGTRSNFNILLNYFGCIGSFTGFFVFSGSIFAFLKLKNYGVSINIPGKRVINSLFLIVIVITALYVIYFPSYLVLILFYLVALLYGFWVVYGMVGADMPVVISFFNALTGFAVVCNGLVLDNWAMIVAGTLVSSSSGLLAYLIGKTMNRSLIDVLLGFFNKNQVSLKKIGKKVKTMEINEAAMIVRYVKKVIIVPGYGVAVSQAQQKIWELVSLLIAKKVKVKFAIHPIAGRMPGHMNILLAEGGVPDEYIFDLEDINDEFEQTDVVLVVGANDVVNLAAFDSKNSPIYGMPILNVECADKIIVIKRGKGRGYAGVRNPLFYRDNCYLVYGDAREVVSSMVEIIKNND